METLKKILSSPFILLIRIYQIFLSPILPRSCRYEPSCSAYAIEAFTKRGPILGLYYTIRRVSRCHPWSHRDRWDPVPERKKNRR